MAFDYLPHLSETAVREGERGQKMIHNECILNITVKSAALLDTEKHIENTHFKHTKKQSAYWEERIGVVGVRGWLGVGCFTVYVSQSDRTLVTT